MRSTVVALVLAGTLGLPLGACGDDGASTPPTTAADVPSATAVSPPIADGSVVPAPAVARPGAADVHPLAWDEVVPSPDGRSLEVRFWYGIEPCNVVDRVEVDETDTTVTVTLYVGLDPAVDADTNQSCDDIGQYRAVTVALDEAVGDRRVVDGAGPEGTDDGPPTTG